MAQRRSKLQVEIPSELVQLVSDLRIRESLPGQFEFANKEGIVDLMEFLDLEDTSNFDVKNGRIRFARNGDGLFLYIDLNDGNLEVMQEEFDDICSIDVTLDDLLKARWSGSG